MAGNERSTFGRSADLAQAQALLTSQHVRLLTLTGRAGVGKTHVAFDLIDSLGMPTVVVELAGIRDPALVGSEVATGLGVPSLPGEDALAAITGRIGNDDVLLVLDNFEHLLEAAGLVGDLVHRCPSLRVVVTSQSPLRLRIEHVLALEPLPLPVGDDAEALRGEPAVALYCERARAVERSFELTDQNAAVVADVCRLLEGLPLSIELAAACAPRRCRRAKPWRRLWTRRSICCGGREPTLRPAITTSGRRSRGRMTCCVQPSSTSSSSFRWSRARSTWTRRRH